MIDFACKTFSLDEIVRCSLGLTRAEMRLLNLLLRKKCWFSADEVASSLAVDLSTAQRSLKSLHDKDIVERRQRNLSGGGYTYSYCLKDKDDIRSRIMDIIHSWVGRVRKELEAW